MSQSASQKTQTSNLFKTKRQESFWTCAKKPAKLDNLNNYHKQQFSPEQMPNKDHFDLYIQLFAFIEDTVIFKPLIKPRNNG